MTEIAELTEQEAILEKLPENIRRFIKENLKAQTESALKREQEINELLAGSTSPEDREAAIAALEEADQSDKVSWNDKRDKGLITVIPPETELGNKQMMLALKHDDPEVYELFNKAASTVTRIYFGRHHLGVDDNPIALSAWELRPEPNVKPSMQKLEQDTLQQMLIIAQEPK